MRVLFTTWASTSHYHPMVPIAWALRAAGHDVRMTSQPALLPAMRASGLPSTVVGRDVDAVLTQRSSTADPVALARRADRISGGLLGDLGVAATFHSGVSRLGDEARAMFRDVWTGRASDTSSLAKYADVAVAMADDLLGLARSWRPDLVVYDPLTYAGPLVAAILGVPAVRCLFGPDNRYFAAAAEEMPVWVALRERYGVIDVDFGVATLDPCPPSLYPAEPFGRLIRTRYVPYAGLADVPSWLPDTPPRPRICLTWGTSTDQILGANAFLPGDVLAGCAKLAEERNAELVLAITARQRPLLPELPGNVRVLESVPLDVLLATCTAIVHQGGAGTTLTALRHGLPQIVLAQRVDQATIACQLASTGAARTGTPTSDVLALGHELLDDPAYRVAAEHLRAELLAQPSPARAVPELVSLAG